MPTSPGLAPTRKLSQQELAHLLALDIPAHLATLDPAGFPRITPLWFLWEQGTFYMTSVEGKRHVADLVRDPHAGLCIDVEKAQSSLGTRPNCQITVRGYAQVMPDVDGVWTRKITLKYVTGESGAESAQRRAALPRLVIALSPERFWAIGTSLEILHQAEEGKSR